MAVSIWALLKPERSPAAANRLMVDKIDAEDFSSEAGQCYFKGLRPNFRALLTST